MQNVIIYEGPSMLDGSPIVCIATGLGNASRNPKTGRMVQTWILRADIHPLDAVKSGADHSICGTCPHRRGHGGDCYVEVGQAPSQVYKAYKRGIYAPMEDPAIFKGRKVRMGAYGDPAAVPFDVWRAILAHAEGWTGYTHQARHKAFDARFADVCMISADSERQAAKYQALGYRTFRVRKPSERIRSGEIECPNTTTGIQCDKCGLCAGKSTAPSVTIEAHGSVSKRINAKLL